MEDGGDIEASLERVRDEMLKDHTPCIGMEFESENAAYRFYSEYGRMRKCCIPVLRRWRLDAKSCSSTGKEVMVEENDQKLLISTRYRYLCPRMVKLAARASEDEEAYIPQMPTSEVTTSEVTLPSQASYYSQSSQVMHMPIDLGSHSSSYIIDDSLLQFLSYSGDPKGN